MMRPVALAAITTVAMLAVMAVGCQTYDFEPVTPLTLAQTTQVIARVAKKLKPNVMLLVDKSGSMLDPIDKNDGRCPSGCGSLNPCPGACPTRISDLRNAMSAFLATSGSVARFGLTFFPSDAVCNGPVGNPLVEFPMPTSNDDGTDMALAANATRIINEINRIAPIGGTPTGASLAFVGGVKGMSDDDNREDVVLLLTDGLPNCNQANPNQQCTCNPNVCGAGGCPTNSSPACAAQATSCACTTGNCTVANNLCARGCLDRDNTVDQVVALRAKGIKTLVIGFGADTSTGDALSVLQAMGEAGGFAKRCPMGTTTECGSAGRCDPVKLVCERKFYQASNQSDLQAVLAEFAASLEREPCAFPLDEQPTDPRYLAVLVEGVNVPQGPSTWTYANGAVTFEASSSYCTAMKASTPAAPVNVEIRIIQQL